MADRAKVMKALELEFKYPDTWECVDECPYYGDTDCNCYAQLAMDALELLKADQSVIDQIEWERDTALEQLAEVDKSLGEKMDDLRELVQKRGRWVRLTGMAPPEYHGHKVCSLCESMAPHHPIHIANEILTPYCPGCGAEMECDRDEQ